MRLFPVLLLLVSASTAFAQDTKAPCKIHGRLVSTDGQPVVGASLEVSGTSGSSARVQGWTNPAAVLSDEKGRFTIEFVPPRAYRFLMRLSHDDFGSIAWRWDTLAPGETIDLDETALEPRAVIVGHLVNSEGELLVEDWLVFANHLGDVSRPRTSYGSGSEVDPTTGTFRIEDQPPGILRLYAQTRTGAPSVAEHYRIEAGEETEIVYVVSSPMSRIELTIYCRPFYGFRPDVGTVFAWSDDGELEPLTRVRGRINDWQTDRLEPGVYTIEITDEKYETWRQENVRPGMNPRAMLRGSAGLELSVVDPQNDGAPVTEYGLRVWSVDPIVSPRTFTLQGDAALAPADGRFLGIVPGSWVLEVRPQGGPPKHIEVHGLGPGEVRKVTVRLGATCCIAGLVQHLNGTPAAGARVQLTYGKVAGHAGPPGMQTSTILVIDGERRAVQVHFRDAETVVGADGTFDFPGLAAGEYTLRAIASPWVQVDARVQVTAGQTAERALELPGSGAIRVRVALPAGTDASKLFAGVRLPDGMRPISPPGKSPKGAVRLAPDGTCTLSGLPSGMTQVHLTWRPQEAQSSGSSNFTSLPLGAVEVTEGGTVELASDLSRTFAARGTLAIHLGGTPAPRASVVLVRLDDGPLAQVVPSVRDSVRNGSGSIDAVPPGRYRVQVEGPGRSWQWTAPDELVVECAKPLEVALDVPVITRTLRVLDADGKPHSSGLVYYGRPVEFNSSAWATTDAHGRLELRLPAGEYIVRADRLRDGGTPFMLARGDGELEVRLPAKD